MVTGKKPVWGGNENAVRDGLLRSEKERISREGDMLIGEIMGDCYDGDNYDGLMLRVGQCWRLRKDEGFYEVLGIKEGVVSCRRWSLHK
jgi:hypothetical protein